MPRVAQGLAWVCSMLSLLDAALTVHGVRLGFVEVNPVLASVLMKSPLGFVALKISLWLGSVVLIFRLDERSRAYALGAQLVLLLVVDGWWLWLLGR